MSSRKSCAQDDQTIIDIFSQLHRDRVTVAVEVNGKTFVSLDARDGKAVLLAMQCLGKTAIIGSHKQPIILATLTPEGMRFNNGRQAIIVHDTQALQQELMCAVPMEIRQ